MPSDAATKVLLDSHEDRLQTVEKAMVDFVGTVKPSLVRLEEGMTYVKKTVGDMEHRLDVGADKFVDQDQRLRELETHVSTRKERRRRIGKWAAGIVSTIVAAVILAMMGVG